MKLLIYIAALFTAAIATDDNVDFTSMTTTVYLQPIESYSTSITSLAEVQYDPAGLTAEFISYNAPELSRDANLVRVGIYDYATKTWQSSTSITSAASFSKGFAPIITLSLDVLGEVIGVTCKSGKIDAGQTRDFGPKIRVVKMTQGKRPELNRPIVVSKEGIVEGDVPEKTMMQKYWWVGAAAVVFLLATGGGDK